MAMSNPTALDAGKSVLDIALPVRQGSRPRTTPTNPHSQLDQMPTPLLNLELAERVAQLPGVQLGPSGRAPPGTVGFYLKKQDAHGPEEAFLLDLEFAHLHPSPDGSLHLPLPGPLRSKAIANGWAEKHPLAGHPTVSRDIVMFYAPRDPAELEVVATLVTASWRYARGH